MKTIQLSKTVNLPLDAVTQTFGILAVRGVGKTYTALVMAEGMLKAHLQVVVLDPLGVCWGLRSSANGKGPGLPILVIGGRHGDLPLTVDMGDVLARLAAEQHLSMVLDMSEFRKSEQRRFVTSFAENLYHYKNEHPDPMMLILDEADEFAPQKPPQDSKRLLGAFEDIVRRGRTRGLGVTLVTQRAAVLNKDVLTQIGTLIVMRTMSPNDTKAVGAWVEQWASTEARMDTFYDSLPELKIGWAWFWSPAWLGLFKKIHVNERTTFDSSATPKVGHRLLLPKKAASVDIEAVRAQLAEFVEEANENDPAELRRLLHARDRQIQQLQAGVAPAPPPPKEKVRVVEQSVLGKRDRRLLRKMIDLSELIHKNIVPALGEIRPELHAEVRREAVVAPRQRMRREYEEMEVAAVEVARVGRRRGEAHDIAEATKFVKGKAAKRILTVLARHPEGRSKKQLAIETGYAHGGGAFNNPLGKLRTLGLVVGLETITATPEGLRVLGPIERLPEGDALFQHWMTTPHKAIGKAARLILQALHDAYPAGLTKQSLAVQTGYNAGGGAFNNPLGRLRTLGLIEGRQMIKLSSTLAD